MAMKRSKKTNRSKTSSVLQGYSRIERFKGAGNRAAVTRLKGSTPRPDLLPAKMGGEAGQARPAPGRSGVPRPDLLPAKLRGTVGQTKIGGRSGEPWSRSPRPELLPGMGPARVGGPRTAAQARSSRGVSTTPIPADRRRAIGDGRPLAPAIRQRMESFFRKRTPVARGRGLRPQSSTAGRLIQPSTRDEETSFAELIGAGGYTKQPIIIMTLSYDKSQEQSRLASASAAFYKDHKCVVANSDCSMVYDCGERKIVVQSKKNMMKAVQKKDIILVVTTHGNLGWLFGTEPGHEDDAAAAAALQIQGFASTYNTAISRVILDACWSASELKTPTKGISNDSPARTVSRVLGKGCHVFGFNGKAASGVVNYLSSSGEKAKGTYADNVVIFVDGDVVKGTTHKEQGKGVTHSTEHMGDDYYTDVVFEGKLPELYRTNSFSKKG